MRNFEKYCKEFENIENYEKAKAANFIGWHCHHRREVELSRKELIALGMYYGVTADELIFLTRAEHNSLHKKGNINMLGKTHSAETKRKIGEKSKGRQAMLGKTHSDKTRKKISDAKKNMSEETKKKIGAVNKDCHWYNNGEINIRAKECPEGFVPGRLKRK